jgi:hypothetical protein
MAIVQKKMAILIERICRNQHFYSACWTRGVINTQKRKQVSKPREVIKVYRKTVLREDIEYLKSILDVLEYPTYVFLKKKSCNLDNAYFHKKSNQFLTLDIQKFYPNTKETHIRKFFKHHSAFKGLLSESDIDKLISLTCISKELMTGSPASTALAFWCNYKMFDELNQLALSYNLNFSVYADDLTFSGDFIPKKLEWQIRCILKRHKYSFNKTKTKQRTFKQGVNITGVILQRFKLRPPDDFYTKSKLDNPKAKPYIKRILKLNTPSRR